MSEFIIMFRNAASRSCMPLQKRINGKCFPLILPRPSHRISYMVVAVLTVIVAGFGLSTTMKVRVQERTREIGILKSMGANHKQVFSMITAESVYTCLFSFAICLLLGIPFAALAIQVIGVIILEIPLTIPPLVILAALAIWLAVTLSWGQQQAKKPLKTQ